VEIPDWNVNCSSGPLLKNTGEIKPIRIKRTNHRAAKKELEFVFELEEPTTSAKTTDTKKTTAKSKEETPKAEPKDNDNAIVVGDRLLDEIFAELNKQGVNLQGKELQIKAVLTPKVQQHLTILKNTAFSHGFTCHLERKPSPF